MTRGDCDGAIQIIDPLYQSRYSTNRARTLRASAYGCRAGIDFFTMISNLTTANLSGGSFWNSMARIFPDTGGHMEATWQAQDALLSVIRTGTYVSTVNQITTNAYNPGSVIASDRTQDANTYLIFISLAVIGTTENRYGNPDPNNNYNQRQTLPWTAAALVNETGCSMASAILNLFDAIHEVSGTATGNLATSLNTISSLQSSFDAACGGTCSTLLRNRESCTGAATQENIDAAAIINVVNASWP